MRTKAIIALVVVLMVSGISVLAVSGASHNDAPTISEDPVANNTDVYAFVSTEEGREDYVTIIANYLPMLEPGNGPTFSHPSENVLYRIHVDLDGDGRQDINYLFEFENEIANESTFLYNTGPIGMPSDPSDPSSQYTNLNFLQSYTLTEVMNASDDRDINELLTGARVAPNHVGPQSTGTVEEYEALALAAIHSIGDNSGGMRVFVGPRDEGFYADLMGAFDLINIRDPGVDTFSGFNVYTIALEIPRSHFTEAGDEDGIIGVWASAMRPKTTVLSGDGDSPDTSEELTQVSRMGNPLVNELLMPFSAKDHFNASEPRNDEDFADFIVNPGDSQGAAALIPLLTDP